MGAGVLQRSPLASPKFSPSCFYYCSFRPELMCFDIVYGTWHSLGVLVCCLLPGIIHVLSFQPCPPKCQTIQETPRRIYMVQSAPHPLPPTHPLEHVDRSSLNVDVSIFIIRNSIIRYPFFFSHSKTHHVCFILVGSVAPPLYVAFTARIGLDGSGFARGTVGHSRGAGGCRCRGAPGGHRNMGDKICDGGGGDVDESSRGRRIRK